ncbi:uncharacterized protein CANTADRAFT_26382 [Suhomyces tanzawaensis NRRL Y-17324]|uniref:Programmed cell death protein 2 C-terminal domain-containing protein n=1 Tax=Suhomyces tanzawaensis NRRL Y-17324 TaxID=984487 RepID=A0A1E4SIY5_9ASCO|nr:uncharacterized protein CANTADRAFT_26382 [Suhomyces tanzawaensis NRRL Y-17324]ODV79473.1 hypothetical protein CANTADRAFT_26382 [Suhomyces tanzawaensis NRRL Y-17324]
MSSHDEYSSDEEDLFDTEKSSVLLGFVDGEIVSDEEDDEYDEPSIEDTFIGGKPVWFEGSARPAKKSTCCDNCGAKMALLLQAFAPLDGKLYDRVIYIFACKNSAQCSKKKGSVKAIRGIGKNPEKVAQIKKEQQESIQKQLDEKLQLENKKKLHIEMTKDLFTSDKQASNPFGSSSNPFSNPFSTPFAAKEAQKPEAPEKVQPKAEKTSSYASVASKNAPPAKKPERDTDDERPSYPGCFIYVEQEKFKKETEDSELEKYKHLIDMDVDKDQKSGRRGSTSSVGSSGPSVGPMDPGASKISSMLDDKYFEAFTNTVKSNPGQVLRYDLGGRPLLYSGRDEVAAKFGKDIAVPKPAYNPSSFRRFELQLMPKAIMDLERLGNSASVRAILDGMSWGTIIVCTDHEDYIAPEEFEDHAAYVEEWCGVQWEESV